MSKTSPTQLTRWQKLGYGIGDLYGGGTGVLISFYYLVFLVDVVQIRPQLAGLVILLSKIYDAITDPLEGMLADRTRTSLGRRRPYLIAGVGLTLLSLVGLFFPFSHPSEGVRTALVVVTYLFYSTVVSIVMLNYNALQSELTPDYDERTQLSALRIFFSAISALVAALLPLHIVGRFPDIRQGWLAVGLAFGVFFALPLIATSATVHEHPEFQHKPEPFRWPAALIEPFNLRTFRVLLAMYLLAFVALDCTAAMVVFFVRNYLGREEDVGIVSGLVVVTQVVAMPLYLWLMHRFSKVQGYIVGACLWALVMLGSLLILPEMPDWVLYTFAALVGIGVGGISLSTYAMFPDIPDVDELESGQRREGMYSSLFTLARKFSSAIAVFLVAQVIGMAGYLPPRQVVVDEVAQLVHVPQPQGFLLALRLLFALLPVGMLLTGVLVARHYPLTRALHAQLESVLESRRQAGHSLKGVDVLVEALSGSGR
ncbi:MAG: MFS transporter [Anaerolineae bacterium]|nr:MFS transporter [Anaerolineae bacterium]